MIQINDASNENFQEGWMTINVVIGKEIIRRT